jgi:hypothetical protein
MGVITGITVKTGDGVVFVGKTVAVPVGVIILVDVDVVDGEGVAVPDDEMVGVRVARVLLGVGVGVEE